MWLTEIISKVSSFDKNSLPLPFWFRYDTFFQPTLYCFIALVCWLLSLLRMQLSYFASDTNCDRLRSLFYPRNVMTSVLIIARTASLLPTYAVAFTGCL